MNVNTKGTRWDSLPARSHEWRIFLHQDGTERILSAGFSRDSLGQTPPSSTPFIFILHLCSRFLSHFEVPCACPGSGATRPCVLCCFPCLWDVAQLERVFLGCVTRVSLPTWAQGRSHHHSGLQLNSYVPAHGVGAKIQILLA